MRTARSSNHQGGGLHTPLEQTPPGPGTPLGADSPGPGTTPRPVADPPPMDRILDTRYWKYYLAPNFVCGR